MNSKKSLIILILGLLTSSVISFYSDDPGANVVGSTATGALIGGLAGGGRGAGIGAGVGLGIGLLSNASRRNYQNRQEYGINQEEQNQNHLNSLYDEHERLMEENNGLTNQLQAKGMNTTLFRSNLDKQTFSSTIQELHAVKNEIKQLKRENKSLKRRLHNSERRNKRR